MFCLKYREIILIFVLSKIYQQNFFFNIQKEKKVKNFVLLKNFCSIFLVFTESRRKKSTGKEKKKREKEKKRTSLKHVVFRMNTFIKTSD